MLLSIVFFCGVVRPLLCGVVVVEEEGEVNDFDNIDKRKLQPEILQEQQQVGVKTTTILDNLRKMRGLLGAYQYELDRVEKENENEQQEQEKQKMKRDDKKMTTKRGLLL